MVFGALVGFSVEKSPKEICVIENNQKPITHI